MTEKAKIIEKATFDDLIRLKLRREEQREKPIEIQVESLGKTLVFKFPSNDQQLDLIADIQKLGAGNTYEAYRKFVYDCCPMLHDTKLHEELGVVDPYDVMNVLFLPSEVLNIGDEIAAKTITIREDIKNS